MNGPFVSRSGGAVVAGLFWLLAGAGPAAAEVFSDGDFHLVDYRIFVDAHVYDGGPQDPTIVELTNGGRVDGYLYVHDGSEARLTGGTVDGWLELRDQSSLAMTSGQVDLGIKVDSSGSANLRGGSAGALNAGLSSSVEVDGIALGGPSAWCLSTRASAHVVVRGGQLYPGCTVYSDAPSVLEFHGADFELDGVPVPYGELVGAGELTGMLRSGDPLAVTLCPRLPGCTGGVPTGTVLLVAAPLAVPSLGGLGSILLCLAMLGAGMGSVTYGRSRRQVLGPSNLA